MLAVLSTPPVLNKVIKLTSLGIAATLHNHSDLPGICSHYFPMQNWLKMESSKSSVAVLPTISPIALTAMRKSNATSSSVRSPRNASIVLCVAARARFSAS